MVIALTEKAAGEVRRKMEAAKVEPDMFLRVGIKAGGCSGYDYNFSFAKDFTESNDTKYDCHGVTMVVDKKSALLLEGTTIDWYEGLDRQGFTFDNPNAVKTCGCGSSFQA